MHEVSILCEGQELQQVFCGFSWQDLRALTLLLSVHTPKQLNSALIPTLQELLNKCRTCQQQKNSLQEEEAKERKTKGLCCPRWHLGLLVSLACPVANTCFSQLLATALSSEFWYSSDVSQKQSLAFYLIKKIIPAHLKCESTSMLISVQQYTMCEELKCRLVYESLFE